MSKRTVVEVGTTWQCGDGSGRHVVASIEQSGDGLWACDAEGATRMLLGPDRVPRNENWTLVAPAPSDRPLIAVWRIVGDYARQEGTITVYPGGGSKPIAAATVCTLDTPSIVAAMLGAAINGSGSGWSARIDGPDVCVIGPPCTFVAAAAGLKVEQIVEPHAAPADVAATHARATRPLPQVGEVWLWRDESDGSTLPCLIYEVGAQTIQYGVSIARGRDEDNELTDVYQHEWDRGEWTRSTRKPIRDAGGKLVGFTEAAPTRCDRCGAREVNGTLTCAGIAHCDQCGARNDGDPNGVLVIGVGWRCGAWAHRVSTGFAQPTMTAKSPGPIAPGRWTFKVGFQDVERAGEAVAASIDKALTRMLDKAAKAAPDAVVAITGDNGTPSKADLERHANRDTAHAAVASPPRWARTVRTERQARVEGCDERYVRYCAAALERANAHRVPERLSLAALLEVTERDCDAMVRDAAREGR